MRIRLAITFVYLISGLLGTGCYKELVGILRLDVDGPLTVPALSLPMDTSKTFRISVWGGVPTVPDRVGIFTSTEETGPWEFDSLLNSDGSWSKIIRRPPYSMGSTNSYNPNFRWQLPGFQGGVYAEVNFLQTSAIGLGIQGSTGSLNDHWIVEGRYAFSVPEEKPVLRTSLGGFLASQRTDAEYFRQIGEGPAFVFPTGLYTKSDGYFMELLLSDSSPTEPLSVFFGLLYSYQNLYRFRIPAPRPEAGVLKVEETMSLWAVSTGVHIRLTHHASLVLGTRIVWEASIEDVEPSAYLLPLAQMDIRF